MFGSISRGEAEAETEASWEDREEWESEAKLSFTWKACVGEKEGKTKVVVEGFI